MIFGTAISAGRTRAASQAMSTRATRNRDDGRLPRRSRRSLSELTENLSGGQARRHERGGPPRRGPWNAPAALAVALRGFGEVEHLSLHPPSRWRASADVGAEGSLWGGGGGGTGAGSASASGRRGSATSSASTAIRLPTTLRVPANHRNPLLPSDLTAVPGDTISAWSPACCSQRSWPASGGMPEWAILDSNQGPPPYQSGALTN